MADAESNIILLKGRTSLTPAQLALVASVRKPLAALAASLIQGSGPTGADDLLQIGLEIACKLAPDYRPGKSQFLTFIYTTARGAMVEARDAEARERRLASAANRATEQVLEIVDLGDVLGEDAAARLARREEARYALAAASIIGMSQAPLTPEELVGHEQEQLRLQAAVRQVLDALDPIDRRLIELAIMDDHAVADAGRQLDLDYDAARYRLKKALDVVGRNLTKLLRAP